MATVSGAADISLTILQSQSFTTAINLYNGRLWLFNYNLTEKNPPCSLPMEIDLRAKGQPLRRDAIIYQFLILIVPRSDGKGSKGSSEAAKHVVEKCSKTTAPSL